jgi:hypothetical protein
MTRENRMHRAPKITALAALAALIVPLLSGCNRPVEAERPNAAAAPPASASGTGPQAPPREGTNR